MSYQNVFFGDLKNPSFYSREGDDLEGTEQSTYLPTTFTDNPLITKQPMNIGYHFIVYKPESVAVTFYITKDPTHYGEDIKTNIENSVANIQTHIDREDGDLTIKWLGVNEEMRGKKLGQFLITMALLYTTTFDGTIKLATLDDDSDNYANGIEDDSDRRKAQIKNIYCKMGFVYEDDTGGPEMEGNVHELMEKNIKKFVKTRSRSSSISSRSRSGSSSMRSKTPKKKM